MSSKASLFILSAPSGSGKTSLAHRLMPLVDRLVFSVSHTTRERRPGEMEGQAYYFVSEKEFERMIADDAFLEHANVYGNYYGTSRRFVEAQLERGNDVLLDIDIQGARKVRKRIPEAVMVFVLPPSFEVLEERLRRRGLDDDEVIERRLKIAREEIAYYREYDFVVINQDLDRSVEELRSILVSTRCCIARRAAEAEEIVATFC